MKKVTMFVLVLGSFDILAQDDSCDSVLEKVWCFLWGNPDNRGLMVDLNGKSC